MFTPNGWRWSATCTPSRAATRACSCWQLLSEHGTKSYDQAVALPDELLDFPGVREVEEFEKFTPEEYIANFFKHDKPMIG